MADALIKVAAARALRSAESMERPEGLYDEFCARFPFPETEDQLRAIEDTLGDLSAGKPMDRLVCGDVGFGKTRSEEHTSELQSLMRISYAVFCLKKTTTLSHY